MLEGLGRELAPEFDLLGQSKYLAGVLIKTKYSPEKMLENLYYLLMKSMDFAKNLPFNLSEIVEKITSYDRNNRPPGNGAAA